MSTSSDKFEIDLRKNLVEIFEKAFPNRDHLAAMLEDELYTSLDGITSNEPDYKISIRNLVRWAQTEGKLCDLVIGAARQKPGNSKLRQFTAENLKNILILDVNLEPPIKDLLDSLVTCLRAIVNFEEIVLLACEQTLPDIENNHPALVKDITEPELSGDVKWLVVLSLFLKDYYGQNSRSEYYLITFIQRIQELSHDSDLAELIKALPPAVKPQLVTKVGMPAVQTLEAEQLKSIDVVFVISIEYPEATASAQDDQFTVQAYLLFYPGKENPPFSIQQVSLSLPSVTDSTRDGKSSPSTMSLLVTMVEVKESLAEWVRYAEKLAEDKCFDLKTTHGLNNLPAYNLEIEFWLPFNAILTPVDRWERYRPVSRWRTGDSTGKQPIGERHPIVVRSYDRFIENDPFNQLNSAWQSIEAFWSSQPDAATVSQKIKTINNLNCHDLIKADGVNHRFGHSGRTASLLSKVQSIWNRALRCIVQVNYTANGQRWPKR